MFLFSISTIQKIIRQPAIILLMILELVLLFLILFFVHCEYDNNILISISIFGKVHEIDQTTHILINTSIHFLWGVLIFLFAIGTASLFAEFFSDPLLPIYLTKRMSRTKLLLYFYISVVVVIFIIQMFFSGMLNVILYTKTETFYWNLAWALIFGPVLLVALLVSFSALVAVVFEKNIVTFVIVLIVYFLQPFLYDGYAYVSVLLKAGIALFPPISQINNYYLSILNNLGSTKFPLITFVYIFIYIGSAIYIFKKKDIS